MPPRRPPGPATSRPAPPSAPPSAAQVRGGLAVGGERKSSALLQLLTVSPASAFQVSAMISSPASSQVGAGLSWGQGYFWRELVPQQGWSAPAQPSHAAVHRGGPSPLDELRGHKALVKLRSRQGETSGSCTRNISGRLLPSRAGCSTTWPRPTRGAGADSGPVSCECPPAHVLWRGCECEYE